MTIWLMDAEEIKKIEAIYSRPIDANTAKEIKATDHYANDVVIDSNGVGTIQVKGVLTPNPDPLLDYWGVTYTAYSDIRKQASALKGDKSVKTISLDANSPGGQIDGVYSTMDAIANIGKPIVTKATGTLASAAYMVASQTDSIAAVDDLTIVGSNGVVIDHFVSDHFVSVTNTKSEKKRNDVTTPKGLKDEKSELDDIYNVIVEKIASGRNTTVEAVNANYGQGSIMTARTALKNGMIDSIGFSNGSTDIENKINNKTSGFSGKKKDLKMETLTELKAQHPDLYATCFNTGVEAGKKEYQQLACNHLELAGLSGAMDRAVEDIKAGNEVTPAVSTFHSIQGIKKAQIDAHGGEAPPVVGEGEAPLDNAHKGEDDKEAKEAKSIFAKLGVEVG